MKSILMTIGSAALFASVISAAPARPATRQNAGSAFVDLQTGDGDSTVGFAVTLDVLFGTAANNRGAEQGISASTDAGHFCQAFSDAAGTKPLGSVFGTTKVFFTDSTTGGVSSVSSDAVPIGAFCCSASQAGTSKCKGISSGSGSGTNNAGSGKTSPPSSSSPPPTVRVQLEGDNGESGAQGEIRADGVLQVLSAPFFDQVDAAFIVDDEGLHNPTCQAFADVNGKSPVGQPFGQDTVSLNGNSGKDVTVKALKCKAN